MSKCHKARPGQTLAAEACAQVARPPPRAGSALELAPPAERFFSGFRVHLPAQNAFPFTKFALGFGLDLLGFPWICLDFYGLIEPGRRPNGL